MDLYTFIVEDFIIHDTRSLHNDTLQLSYSAFVDGDAVANRVISLGDFDNGEYSTVDYVSSDQGPGLAQIVINNPTAKVAFIFQLVNAGNVPAGALTGRLAATADQLSGIAAGLAGAGAANAGEVASSAVFPVALLLEAFADLYSWLQVDCDGPVAVDQISGPRYVLDAWTDNSTQLVRIQRRYPGSDSSTGCGGNSDYEVIWSLQHSRAWVPVTDSTGQLISETGISASEHNGAVHAFGVVAGGGVNHARTFTGATWNVDALGPFNLALLPVSAVSFDDRLYIFGILADGSISSLAFTVDGGSWLPKAAGPGTIQTAEAIATAVFRNRLYIVARDSASSELRITSTSDLDSWNPWVNVPSSGMKSASAVAAVTLKGTLFVFEVVQTGKTPGLVVMRNSTSDGATWSGWDLVEGGARPDGAPVADPMDVAAGIFRGRIYLASRWQPPDSTDIYTDNIFVNFSEDGDNWSGWRIPQSSHYQASGTAGVAAVGNHLYILTPHLDVSNNDTMHVWAY